MTDSSVSQSGYEPVGPSAGVEPSAAFTPGPWKIIGPLEDGDRIISTVTYDTIAPVWASGWGTVENPAVQRANARLIAAAPDLLEALKQWRCGSCGGTGLYTQRTALAPAEVVVCKVCGGDGEHPIARTAIAKALGPSAHDTSDGQASPGRDQ